MRNIYACLVHESEECVVDLVHSLRTLDGSSGILLYDGSESGALLGRFPFQRYGATIVPHARPMKWGRLHGFAVDCMRFALDNCAFDTLTIVDSDQLPLRGGYPHYLRSFATSQPRVGMFVTDPNAQTCDSASGPARAVFGEFELWQRLFQSFGASDAPIYWTFWPATVFTASAAADLVKAMTSHRALMDLLDQTSIWATEEVVFPTVATLLGYELGLNPCSAAYVQHRAEYGLRDLAAALAQPDAYWIHPVPRNYDDRLRAAVRSLTHAGDFDRPLPPFAQMEKRTHVEAINAALAAMSPVSGWLDQQEAAVLLRSAANTLSSAGPSPYVVEVGSYYGRSTVALGTLLSRMAHDGRLFAIDPHTGALSPGAAVSAAEDTWEPFSRNVALSGLTNVVVPVRAQAENVDIDVPVDVLFIDGLHDYPNVARDCLRFEPSVVDGGLVAFHDYSVDYPGVVTFVQELLSTRRFALVAREGSLVVLRKQPHRAPVGGEEGGDGEVHQAQGPAVRRARPRASCIMLTRDRPEWVDLALQCFEHQDFIQKELIIVDSGNQSVERLCKGRPRVLYHQASPGLTLGELRNVACQLANGDVIAHWDDDDWSAHWRLTYQIEELASAPWSQVCGLQSIIFSDAGHTVAWQYAYPPGCHPWVAGGTLCYLRSFWQTHPFLQLTEGEDNHFVWEATPNEVLACEVNTFFVGHIHAGNTSAKDTSGPFWSPYPVQRVRQLIQGDRLGWT